MLRYLRIAVALVMFALPTLYLLDFTGSLPIWMSWVTRIQFIPSIVSGLFVATGAILLATLLTGRLYCSVVCPLGIMQDVIAWCSKLVVRKKKYKYAPAKTFARWFFFVVFLAAWPVAMVVVCLLEPYGIYGRIMNGVVGPAVETVNNLFAWCFIHAGSNLMYFVDPTRMLPASLVALALFLVIATLAACYGRSWCNVVCPVGTLLGLLSRMAILKIRVDKSKCNRCGLCAMNCKASCIDSKLQRIDSSRCVDCFNCLGVCRRGAISYGPARSASEPGPAAEESPKEPEKPGPAESRSGNTVDTSKRAFLVSLGTLAAAATACDAVANEPAHDEHAKPQEYDSALMRRKTAICPPGAKASWHLSAHCTGCHLCVSACKSHVLQPSFLEYGIGGMLQPIMRFEKGFCDYDCTLCGDVCPNGAIEPITVEEKHLVQVGRVHFNRELCVVVTDETNCGACSEHCPTQAVTMVKYKGVLTIPEIKPEICIGCGGCEHICPVRPIQAIFVEGNTVQCNAEPFKEAETIKVKLDDFGF